MVVVEGRSERRTGEFPVLIIPGYGAPQYQTDLVGKHLQSNGLDVVKVKLPWMAMGDMTRSAALLSESVKRVREQMGFELVNFFGYSLGGIIARYYLQELEGYPALGRGAFVSAPNAGTYIGYLGFFSPAGRQVRPGSPLIRRLNESPVCDEIAGKCLSIFVRWDGVIVPSDSAYLPFGYNMMQRRPISHWRAVMNAELLRHASEFLKGGMPDGVVPGRELFVPEAGDAFAFPWDAPTGAGRGVWQVLASPFRSLGSRIASVFRRQDNGRKR